MEKQSAIAMEADPTPTDNAYLNTQKASLLANQTPNAIRDLARRNKLKSIRKGNRLYFRKTDILEWLELRRKNRAEDAAPCLDDLIDKKKSTSK